MKGIKKYFLIIILAFVLTLGNKAIIVFAQSGVSSKNVENAFQGAKEALDNLILTKDSGKSDDLSSRIKAFNQVLDLSIAEAKDYAAKLIAIPKNKDYDKWVDNSLKILADNISFYNDQKKLISDSSVSLDNIKKIASDFKNWRDEKYLPFVKSLQTFFLIEQEKNALDIASKRLTNIKKDLSKISLKAKDKKIIDIYISSSSESIEKAKLLNEEAYNMFLNLYVKKDELRGSSSSDDFISTTTLEKGSTTISSTTEENSINVSTKNNNEEVKGEEKAKENISEKEEKILNDESIRVLVKNSLEEIKRAYQNFIDISNYVRKLLK